MFRAPAVTLICSWHILVLVELVGTKTPGEPLPQHLFWMGVFAFLGLGTAAMWLATYEGGYLRRQIFAGVDEETPRPQPFRRPDMYSVFVLQQIANLLFSFFALGAHLLS